MLGMLVGISVTSCLDPGSLFFTENGLAFYSLSLESSKLLSLQLDSDSVSAISSVGTS